MSKEFSITLNKNMYPVYSSLERKPEGTDELTKKVLVLCTERDSGYGDSTFLYWRLSTYSQQATETVVLSGSQLLLMILHIWKRMY